MLFLHGPIVSIVKHRTPNARFQVQVLVGPPTSYKKKDPAEAGSWVF